MLYEIGTIVKSLMDDNKLNRYVIIATKEQNLNIEYLDSKKGKFNIDHISKMAENELVVSPGFDYLIMLIDEKGKNDSSLLNVFESDVII